VLQLVNPAAIPVDTVFGSCWKFMVRRKIILADDEAFVTATLASKLRQAGFEVTTASNGQEAFELAVQNPPDLIVTDYQMPVLSGYEMSVKLRREPRTANVPLIMLTARGHHLSAEQVAATNIRYLAAKPFSVKELLGKVQDVLTGGSARGGSGSPARSRAGDAAGNRAVAEVQGT
jgi:CheY-like chemotaxis protein